MRYIQTIKRLLVIIPVVVALALVRAPQPTVASTPTEPCSEADLYCPATASNELSHLLQNYPTPQTEPPHSNFAVIDFKVHNAITQTVRYSVATKGTITADVATFKKQVQESFDDKRGWTRLGVKFEQVESGGSFTVVLAEASQVPSYGFPCDTEYNCNVGDYVVVNQDRWLYATQPWNAAGGNIRDYRHLIINHETGHWLGHGHIACTAAGQAAPVMDQQSINLHGCKFNSWPLDSEIWSTRLGI